MKRLFASIAGVMMAVGLMLAPGSATTTTDVTPSTDTHAVSNTATLTTTNLNASQNFTSGWVDTNQGQKFIEISVYTDQNGSFSVQYTDDVNEIPNATSTFVVTGGTSFNSGVIYIPTRYWRINYNNGGTKTTKFKVLDTASQVAANLLQVYGTGGIQVAYNPSTLSATVSCPQCALLNQANTFMGGLTAPFFAIPEGTYTGYMLLGNTGTATSSANYGSVPLKFDNSWWNGTGPQTNTWSILNVGANNLVLQYNGVTQDTFLTNGQLNIGSSSYGGTSTTVNGNINTNSNFVYTGQNGTAANGNLAFGPPSWSNGAGNNVFGIYSTGTGNQVFTFSANGSPYMSVGMDGGLNVGGNSDPGAGNIQASGSITASGALFKIVGSGNQGQTLELFDTTASAANPYKFIRVSAGQLEIVNSAFSKAILDLSDAGDLTLTQNGTYKTGSSSYGATSATVNGTLTATQINGSGTNLVINSTGSACCVTFDLGNGALSGIFVYDGGTTNYSQLTVNGVYFHKDTNTSYAYNSATVDGNVTANNIYSNGYLDSKSSTGNTETRLFADVGGQNWLQSGNNGFTANAPFNISGYNGTTGSTLNLKFGLISAAGDIVSTHNIYGSGPATFSEPGGNSAAGLGWNGAGSGEATIYSAYTNPSLAADFYWYNGTAYTLASKIKTDGTYQAGSSTYGPTSANVNGTFTANNFGTINLSGGISNALANISTDGNSTIYLTMPTTSGQNNPYIAQFTNSNYAGLNLKNGMGLTLAPLPAPAAPTLGQTAGGTIAATTYYVKVTYTVNGEGETTTSTESSLAVSANNLLTVTSPVASGAAGTWNVYVSTATGTETLQQSGIAIGTNWTEPTTGLVSGASPPTTNWALGKINIGPSFYGPSSAQVNGAIYLTATTGSGTSANYISGFGPDTIMVQTSDTSGQVFFRAGSNNIGTLNSSGYSIGSSTFGATSATVNGPLTTSNLDLPLQVSLAHPGANHGVIGTDNSGYLTFRAYNTNGFQFQNDQGTPSTWASLNATGWHLGSSTYGPTSATIAGGLTTSNAVNTDSGNANGLGLQINGKNVVYSNGGGNNSSLYLVAPNTGGVYFGYQGAATAYGNVSGSGYAIGSSTYGPTSAYVNGTLTVNNSMIETAQGTATSTTTSYPSQQFLLQGSYWNGTAAATDTAVIQEGGGTSNQQLFLEAPGGVVLQYGSGNNIAVFDQNKNETLYGTLYLGSTSLSSTALNVNGTIENGSGYWDQNGFNLNATGTATSGTQPGSHPLSLYDSLWTGTAAASHYFELYSSVQSGNANNDELVIQRDGNIQATLVNGGDFSLLNGGSFVVGSSTYGPTSATIAGNITIPDGTSGSVFKIGNTGTATSSTNYTSGTLQFDNSNWTGSVAATNNWQVQMGGGSALNFFFNGTNELQLGSDGSLTILGGGKLATGSSSYGPTSETVNGSSSATNYTASVSGYFAIGPTNTNGSTALQQGGSAVSTISATSLAINDIGAGNRAAFDTSGNLGLLGSLYTGSSIYGPTSATINGVVTATQFKLNTVGTNTSANNAINLPTTFSSGTVSSYIGTDAAATVSGTNGQFFSVEGSNGGKLLTVDGSGNLGIAGSFKAGSSIYGPTSGYVNGNLAVTTFGVGLGNASPASGYSAEIRSAGSPGNEALKISGANSSAGDQATIRIIGQRGDGNASSTFGGTLALAHLETDQSVVNNVRIGRIAFGANGGGSTESNILWGGEIAGITEGQWSGTSTPLALGFYVGNTPLALSQANGEPGYEAMRLTSTGNLVLEALSAPATPTLGQTAGGTLAATTYYVKVTYKNANGETTASGEASLAVSANNVLTVTSPAAFGNATTYNVYASTATGTETLQASSIAIGTNWTEPTTGLVAGAALPTVNSAIGKISTGTMVLAGSYANLQGTVSVGNNLWLQLYDDGTNAIIKNTHASSTYIDSNSGSDFMHLDTTDNLTLDQSGSFKTGSSVYGATEALVNGNVVGTAANSLPAFSDNGANAQNVGAGYYMAFGGLNITSKLLAYPCTANATHPCILISGGDTISGVSSSAFEVGILGTAALLGIDSGGNVGAAGSFKTGSSTYGPTSATVNGTMTATTFSGSGASLTSIPNSALVNSTISGVALGSNLNTLTIGTHLTGTSYNGSAAVTIATDATNANTASTIVARDASGNFSAGTGTFAGLNVTGLAASSNICTDASKNLTTTGCASGGSDLATNNTFTGTNTFNNSVTFNSGITLYGTGNTFQGTDFYLGSGGTTAGTIHFRTNGYSNADTLTINSSGTISANGDVLSYHNAYGSGPFNPSVSSVSAAGLTWNGTGDASAVIYSAYNRPSNALDIYDYNNGYDLVATVAPDGTYTTTALAPPPMTPVISQAAGGALAATTYYVKYTYVTAYGETSASTEASFAAAASNVITVTAPTGIGAATGWNVYVSTATGTETKQNSSPIAFGTNWTEPTGGLTSGSALPSNTAYGAFKSASSIYGPYSLTVNGGGGNVFAAQPNGTGAARVNLLSNESSPDNFTWYANGSTNGAGVGTHTLQLWYYPSDTTNGCCMSIIKIIPDQSSGHPTLNTTTGYIEFVPPVKADGNLSVAGTLAITGGAGGTTVSLPANANIIGGTGQIGFQTASVSIRGVNCSAIGIASASVAWEDCFDTSGNLGINGQLNAAGLSVGNNGQGQGVTVNINGDITTERNGATGVIYLGNTGNHYLFFDGSNYQMPNGAVYATAFVNNSRAALKHDIHSLQTVDALGVLHNCAWSSFRYKTGPQDVHYGFIADRCDSLLSGPKRDHFDAETTSTFAALAVLQEDAKVKKLESQVASLQKQVATLQAKHDDAHGTGHSIFWYLFHPWVKVGS